MTDSSVFDPAEHLESEADIAALIADALESGHAGHLANVLGIVARARGMSQVARETGISRAALYASLSTRGNPSLDTLLKVTRALQLKLDLTLA